MNESMQFEAIAPPDENMRARANRRLDILTKPLGALGRLEPLAAQICAIQRTLDIKITHPVGVVFVADHGIAERGVSAYPRAVTAQMVANFLGGGAAISALSKQEGIDLWIVDAGVDADLNAHPRLIDAKIRRGTRNLVEAPAMTPQECLGALRAGREVVNRVAIAQANTLIFGEMGIGNTAVAALLMHALTGIDLRECVGRGTGLDDAGVERKRDVLRQALRRRPLPQDLVTLLGEFGGYEIAMLTAAILAGAARGMLLLIDGFTVSVAAALAARIDAKVLDYCVFAHCSAEQAHPALLKHLGVFPLLDLGMRLGEGSGAAMALPIVRAAATLFTGMATFEGAGVSNKDA